MARQRRGHTLIVRLALVVGLLLATVNAEAHRLSPAYFGLLETDPGRFEATWKVSVSGGGALLVVADAVVVDGAIRVDGGAGADAAGDSYLGGGGGGAGGSVYIAAHRLTVGPEGRISALGGGGGVGSRGAGGAGSAGWIRLDAAELQRGGQVIPEPLVEGFDCAMP